MVPLMVYQSLPPMVATEGAMGPVRVPSSTGGPMVKSRDSTRKGLRICAMYPSVLCLTLMTGRARHKQVHLKGRSSTTASGKVSGSPPWRYDPILALSAYMACGGREGSVES